MSDTLLTIIPKDFYKDRCVIGYGYEVGKLRFKHIRPRLVLAPPPGGGGAKTSRGPQIKQHFLEKYGT